ncbi:MAG: hypothetical protein ACI3ZQ_03860 [Candidatus Cryptobacteroides sp.]
MNKNYISPEITDLEILSEGLLCQSDRGGQANNEELTFEDAIW